MAFGLSNKEIARRLALGQRTIETHVEHVLRKLDVPTRARAVSEGVRAGLLAEATVTSPDARPNNLPFQLTALLGRERDLGDVIASLNKHRLVTLSGSAGVGKTRLGLAAGFDLLDKYPDGVWFCEFSPISDPTLVSGVVAKILDVRERPSRSLVDSIERALKHRRVLLILDNCEHVLNAAADLADEILHSCPNVRILATSRQPLGIIGEVVRRLPSLDVPVAVDPSADEAMASGSVALFVERAQSLNQEFALSGDNAASVTEICRRLDGIPLAIELAAARISFASVESLAQSLDHRFSVLTAGSRTSLPRHRTLSASIEWSHDLLSPREQQLFRRIGVFSGSSSLAAATSVCSLNSLDESDTPDLLSLLVDKSLVVMQMTPDQERYRLLESTRAYALGKLRAAGEWEKLSRRHAEYFCAQARAVHESGVRAPVGWQVETDNYRAALHWALADANDFPLGAALAGYLERFWATSGLDLEGRAWIETALANLNESEQPAVAAQLWSGLSMLTYGRRRNESAGRAAELFASVGDAHGRALALYRIALSPQGSPEEVDRANARALLALRECGDELGVASCLSDRAIILSDQGKVAEGRDMLAQALTAVRILGDEYATARVLNQSAELEFRDGKPELALCLVNEALEILSRGHAAIALATCHNNRAAYRIALGDSGGARASAREGLAWGRRVQSAARVGDALQHLALVAALDGQAARAARMAGYSDAQLREREFSATETWGREKLTVALYERLSETEIATLAAEGAAWSEERAVEEALRV